VKALKISVSANIKETAILPNCDSCTTGRTIVVSVRKVTKKNIPRPVPKRSMRAAASRFSKLYHSLILVEVVGKCLYLTRTTDFPWPALFGNEAARPAGQFRIAGAA
jgi:hypothetical protein